MAQPSSDSGTDSRPNDQEGNNESLTEHRILITHKLIKEMEDEIKRQEEIVRSRDEDIQQLRDEADQLKRRIESIPIIQLTERNKLLEVEIKSKEEEIKRLTDKLRIVLSKDGTSTGKISQLTDACTMLERQRIIHVQTIQKQTDTIEYRNKEIAALKTKLQNTEEELHEERTKVEVLEVCCKKTEEENTELVEAASLAKMEKDQANNEAALYLNRMNELISYEEKCGLKEKEVHDLRANILPDKERTISELTVKVTELQDNFAQYAGNLITKSEHLDILHGSEEHVRQSLRDTYKEEYKTQVDSLEAEKAELERKLEHVESDLKTIQDGNDEIVSAYNAYKHHVSENEKQRNIIQDQKQTILKLNRELVRYKDRVMRMEKRPVNNTLNMNDTF